MAALERVGATSKLSAWSSLTCVESLLWSGQHAFVLGIVKPYPGFSSQGSSKNFYIGSGLDSQFLIADCSGKHSRAIGPGESRRTYTVGLC